ncbi:[4Fe-4S] proteins maturation [Rhodotorula mucilaginosa]|uniref:[4Fe-4S] proteins maturation n=1 Tax=Rhodotorula mucilaginosa TaxID=5537 RepID=A0A9P6VVI3_RHOMI|nr:[4Fe-4S] proteins maturation [Rhodotorula mucilaginosa]
MASLNPGQIKSQQIPLPADTLVDSTNPCPKYQHGFDASNLLKGDRAGKELSHLCFLSGGNPLLLDDSAEPPTNPSEDFEPVEQELKEGEALEMHLTEAAIKQIERAQAKANDPTLSLRLIVESGGCHGYQYKMQSGILAEADSSPPRSTSRFAPPTETTASLLVDSASLPLVKGSTIDYATELIGSAFRIKDNPQSKDAGCGCGVSWELKDI